MLEIKTKPLKPWFTIYSEDKLLKNSRTVMLIYSICNTSVFLNSYALSCAEFEPSINLLAEHFMRLQTFTTSTACWNWIFCLKSSWISLLSFIKFWPETIKDIFSLWANNFARLPKRLTLHTYIQPQKYLPNIEPRSQIFMLYLFCLLSTHCHTPQEP